MFTLKVAAHKRERERNKWLQLVDCLQELRGKKKKKKKKPQKFSFSRKEDIETGSGIQNLEYSHI